LISATTQTTIHSLDNSQWQTGPEDEVNHNIQSPSPDADLGLSERIEFSLC